MYNIHNKIELTKSKIIKIIGKYDIIMYNTILVCARIFEYNIFFVPNTIF